MSVRPSLCPSVCLPHAGIDSWSGGRGTLVFHTNFDTIDPGETACEGFKQTAMSKNGEKTHLCVSMFVHFCTNGDDNIFNLSTDKSNPIQSWFNRRLTKRIAAAAAAAAAAVVVVVVAVVWLNCTCV